MRLQRWFVFLLIPCQLLGAIPEIARSAESVLLTDVREAALFQDEGLAAAALTSAGHSFQPEVAERIGRSIGIRLRPSKGQPHLLFKAEWQFFAQKQGKNQREYKPTMLNRTINEDLPKGSVHPVKDWLTAFRLAMPGSLLWRYYRLEVLHNAEQLARFIPPARKDYHAGTIQLDAKAFWEVDLFMRIIMEHEIDHAMLVDLPTLNLFMEEWLVMYRDVKRFLKIIHDPKGKSHAEAINAIHVIIHHYPKDSKKTIAENILGALLRLEDLSDQNADSDIPARDAQPLERPSMPFARAQLRRSFPRRGNHPVHGYYELLLSILTHAHRYEKSDEEIALRTLFSLLQNLKGRPALKASFERYVRTILPARYTLKKILNTIGDEDQDKASHKDTREDKDESFKRFRRLIRRLKIRTDIQKRIRDLHAWDLLLTDRIANSDVLPPPNHKARIFA